MRTRVVVVFELVVVALCLVGGGACWTHGVRTTSFHASGDEPGFSSTAYSGGWIFGACALVVVAAAVALALGCRVWSESRAEIPSGGILRS
jgi:hypothetical protein